MILNPPGDAYDALSEVVTEVTRVRVWQARLFFIELQYKLMKLKLNS